MPAANGPLLLKKLIASYNDLQKTPLTKLNQKRKNEKRDIADKQELYRMQ